jgi:hypothetical protein
MRERIEVRRVDSQIRVEQVRQSDTQGLRCESEETPVGVEAPWPARYLDLKAGLVRTIQEFVIDLPGVLAVREGHGLSAVPLDLYNRDRPVRKHAPHAGPRREVFKARGRRLGSVRRRGGISLSHVRLKFDE